ncbi:MAG TPA: AsmA family protein [Xanthobacteraceae bacterium]|nr:AsmA family protein [Xanthobacteraceae bacterium]
MQTTLLGLAIAIILALVAALVAPLVVDWNHFRTTFETEASRLTGLSVRVTGTIDARILPTPRIKLRNVEIGEAGREPLLRAGAIDLEVRLGPLIRGEVQASEARLVTPQINLALDRSGAIDWPVPTRTWRAEDLSVSRLRVEDGSIVLADAASGSRLTLQKLSFDGDIRSLLGPFRGEGTFVAGDEIYGYRISGGRGDADNGFKIRLGVNPSNHPLTTDIDGTLTVDRGVPQFDGTIALARPVGAALSSGQRVMNDPWHARGTIRATPAAASLHDVTFQYGPDERAVVFTGKADLTFGAQPHFDGEIAALEVNVDRALAAPDLTHRPPLLVVKSFVDAFVASVKLPLPGKIGVGIAGLTVGGTNVQSLHGVARFDATGWSLDGVELRAPGLTQVSLSGQLKQSGHGLAFTGPGALDSADADTLLAWLSGRGGTASAGVRTLRARGNVTIAGDRLAVDGLDATLDQDNVQGRFAYTWPTTWPASDRPAIVEADLHATKLDLDALTAFAKSAVDENGFAPPRQGSLALDIGKATLAGVDARTVKAQIKFDSGALQIEHLSVGELGGAALDISGRIDELSSQPRGRVTVDLNAGTLADLSRVLGQFAPQTADVLRRAADRLAPAKLHGTLTVERAATAGSTVKLDLNGQLGLLRVALNGVVAGEPSKLGEANVHIDSRLDADDGTALAALFGLSRVVAVDQLPGRVTLSAVGPLNGELRVDGEASASGFTAAVRGAVRLNGKEAPQGTFQGTFQILATAADLQPLQQAMTGQPGNAVPFSARAAVSVAGSALSFTQIAIAAGKASAHGHLAVNLASPIAIDGDVGADNVDGAWLTSVLLGLPRQAQNTPWSSQPLGGGAFAAMNGAVTFTLDHAAFTPALVARNLKGVAQFRPGEITLQNIDGSLAGGHVSGELAFRRNADGLVSHGHVALADADAATVLQTDKKIIDARLTLKADFDSFGSSPAVLVRTAHGSGAIALADARIGGLDPAAFVAAMRAADQGAAIELAKIQAAVNVALASGHLAAPQGDAAMTITDGKVGVANVTLPAQDGAALSLSGALDLNTGTVDARMTLTAPPPAHALIRIQPELAVMLKGPLAAPARSLDVSALTGWLALRAAELQSRRLESIEANGRQDVIGRAVRPDFPVVRTVPAGGLVESAILASASPPPGTRGLDLLQTEAPAAGATGSTTANKPRLAPQPPPPAAPQTAGPPLDLLFHPQN